MFTGIVQTQADILSINQLNSFQKIRINVDKHLLENLEKGASIAINGTCLTVVDFFDETQARISNSSENKGFAEFDIIDETLRVTNLGQLTVGSQVNFERSLKFGDEVGGHIVSGHIHAQAKLIDKLKTLENCQLTFECDEQWQKYLLSKGFITINGVSLTLGEVIKNRFSVHLIPETLARTNLGQLTLGDEVNLEFDQQTITIVETIERLGLTK